MPGAWGGVGAGGGGGEHATWSIGVGEGCGGWGAVWVGWCGRAQRRGVGAGGRSMHGSPLKQFSDSAKNTQRVGAWGCGGWGAVWVGAAGVSGGS